MQDSGEARRNEGAHREAVAALQPYDRAAHDYLGAAVLENDLKHRACLDGTPYDFNGGNQSIPQADFEYKDGIVTITPADSRTEPLRLKNDGPDRPLQGADPASVEQLANFGCETGPYAEAPR